MSPPSFFETRLAGFRVLHREDLTARAVLHAIERHREHAAKGRDACENWGPGSTVSRVLLSGTGVVAAVKWVPWRGARHALSDFVYGSRARRAAAGAERLEELGLPAPKTLAIVERRRAGLIRESFLVMEFIEHALPLPAVVPELRVHPRRRRRVAERIGEVVGQLHAANLDHSDLKHSNLMVTESDEIILLDLDPLEPPRRMTWRRRVRALGQLEAYTRDLYASATRSDRARFLRGYHRSDTATSSRTAELVSEVALWADARIAAWAKKDRSDHYRFPLAPREAAVSSEEDDAGRP